MKYLRAFFIAAAMYSRLPVPNVRWDEESKEAVLFLFPLLGVIEAGLIFLLRLCFAFPRARRSRLFVSRRRPFSLPAAFTLTAFWIPRMRWDPGRERKRSSLF